MQAKMNTIEKWIISISIVLLYLSLGLQKTYGQAPQDTLQVPTDTIVQKDVIPYSEILIASGESRIRTTRIAESLISIEKIQSENQRNDSILALIDSTLLLTDANGYSNENQRFLTNEKNYWEAANNHIKDQKSRLSDLIRDLQNHQQELGSELVIWQNTKNLQDSSNIAFSNIESVIDTTLLMIKNVGLEIERRTSLLIEPLNRTISTEIEVDLLIEKVDAALLEKTSLIYSKTSPNITEVATSPSNNGAIGNSTIESLKSEWNAVLFHYSINKRTYTVYFIFVVLIMVLFFWMSSRMKYLEDEGLTYYESTLKKILQHPLTAGILFSLFFSVAFFPDRPPLLIDIIIVLLLIPIMDIGLRLSSKSANAYYWLFLLSILLYIGIPFLPEDTLLSRYIRLAFGIFELVVLITLLLRPHILKLHTRGLNRFIRLLIIFHVLVAIAGVVTSVLGYESLAQVAIDSIVTNTLVGILLYICSIILIGGIQLLIGSRYVDGLRVIRENEDYLKELISRLVILGVVIFWVDSILRIFYVRNTVYDFISRIFTENITLGSMSFSFGKIALFVVIIWLSIIISRVIKIILRADVLDKFSLKKGIPRMITAITQFSLITLGVLLAVRSTGMPLDQLTIIFSAFSVGIGFGLQNIFNNLVSGVILLFEREVQIGDIIEVGSLMGTVKSMGIRSSHIRTFEGAEVIVPNGQLISKEVVDWTLSDKSRRIEILSGVAYGSDVHLVKKLLTEVIEKHPDVKLDPEPLVLFNDMGESSLDFRLLFWTEQFDQWLRIRSEVIFSIHDILLENDIAIPFPQRDLHVKSIDPIVIKGSGQEN